MNSAEANPPKVQNLLRSVVEREQVEDNLRYALAASIAGLFNACVAVFAFWSQAVVIPLLVWFAAILLGAGLRIVNLRQHRALSAADGGSVQEVRKQRRLIEVIALYNGTCWALGAVFMASVATPAQYVLLIILCSGMMGASVTTYTSMARGAVLFIAPLTIGSLAVLTVGPNAPTLAGSILLACYFLLLTRASFSRQALFIERIKAREELRESGETVKLLLNDFEAQASDWLWEIDSEGSIIKASPRFAEAAGRAQEVLEGTDFCALFEESGEREILSDHIASHYGFRNITLRLQVDGDARWWTLSAQPTQAGGIRGVASDVSAQKQAEERVSYMAHYDGLTGLANRFQFNETLSRELKRHPSEGGVAVLYLDLDSFKTVNDTLGHPTGDKLLCEIARRISLAADEDEVVARFGGDEFAILVSGIGAQVRAEQIAKKAIVAVAEPVDIEGVQMIISTTIGISVSTADENSAAHVMKCADLALYAAKAAGKNQYALFEQGMDHAAEERRQLEMDIRSAVVAGEFELYYQPQIKIETGETASYEALIRWNHPTRGVVMPDEFVPLAEETGLIVPIGEWVLREACEEAAKWPDHLRVSVNLSPVQMRSSSLVSKIFAALAASGLEPSRLELEITENILLHDSETNLATLFKLHDFGIRIALDDFGTGYSSLNYLRSFPFDKIKIDKCFINELDDRPDSLAIVRAVTSLADSLGIETTAEGVEQQGQLEKLRLEGCTEAQGYLFSKPYNPREFSDMRSADETIDKKANIARMRTRLTDAPKAKAQGSAASRDKKAG